MGDCRDQDAYRRVGRAGVRLRLLLPGAIKETEMLNDKLLYLDYGGVVE